MKDGFSRHRIVAVVTIILVLSVFLTRPPQTKALFVIASWDYPDEYGQGIETIYYQIRWANDTNKEYGYTYPNNVSHFFEVPENGTVYLRFTAWVNGTFLGISSLDEAKNLIRFDINVTRVGVNVLTQQNLTRSGGSSASAPMYKVYRLVYLSGFHNSAEKLMSEAFVAGQIYTAVVNCEILH